MAMYLFRCEKCTNKRDFIVMRHVRNGEVMYAKELSDDSGDALSDFYRCEECGGDTWRRGLIDKPFGRDSSWEV